MRVLDDNDKAGGGGSATVPAAGSHEPPPVSPGRAIAIAFVVSGAFLMQGLDSTLLTVAIPAMARDLRVDPLTLHFAITSYTITLAVFMPVSGWFADRLGARTVFCGAMALFTAGSILCGLSSSIGPMIAARVLQGFGGALMTPIGRLIVLRAFGKGRVLDAMTWLTLPILIGPLVGPLVGGIIVTYATWPWIFFVSVPLCVAATAGAFALFPPEPPPEHRPFDHLGFVIAGAGLVLFQLGVENLGHPFAGLLGGAALFVAAFAMVPVYLRHARNRTEPALDVSLFAHRHYLVGVFAGGLGRIGLNSTAFLLPLMLQLGMGLPPLTAGLYACVAAVGAFGTKSIIRHLMRRYGYRRLLLLVVVVGAALLAGWAAVGPGTPAWILLPYVLVLGAVRTMHFNTVNTLTYSEVPSKLLSRAVSAAGVFQQLSMGLGISLSAAVLALVSDPGPALSTHDFAMAFLAMAVVPILSIPILLMLPTADGRATTNSQH